MIYYNIFLSKAEEYKKKKMPRKNRRKKAKTKVDPWIFYKTREWLELRYKVLKTYGRKCMCCGTTTGQMHVDHIKPRSKYPELSLIFTNLQVLCHDCNIGKSNKDQTDWREEWTDLTTSGQPTLEK